jgi:hypothetical protein
MLALAWAAVGCSKAPVDEATSVDDVARRVERRFPSARWNRAGILRADVTLDGLEDAILVGVTDTKAILGVVVGARRGDLDVRILEFPLSGDQADSLCGVDDAVVIQLDPLRLPLDEWGCGGDVDSVACREARMTDARLAVAAQAGGKGVRVSAGECDPIHVYYDQGELKWWRR